MVDYWLININKLLMNKSKRFCVFSFQFQGRSSREEERKCPERKIHQKVTVAHDCGGKEQMKVMW